jgi:hypothetical protein
MVAMVTSMVVEIITVFSGQVVILAIVPNVPPGTRTQALPLQRDAPRALILWPISCPFRERPNSMGKIEIDTYPRVAFMPVTIGSY